VISAQGIFQPATRQKAPPRGEILPVLARFLVKYKDTNKKDRWFSGLRGHLLMVCHGPGE